MMTMGLNGMLYAIQICFDKVLCSISESPKLSYLEVLFTNDDFKTIYTIKTQAITKQILNFGKTHFICQENNAWIEIVDVKILKVVSSYQIKNQTKEISQISTILKTSRQDEYALGILNGGGMKFVLIVLNEDQSISITESEEVCLEGVSVQLMREIQPEIFLVVIEKSVHVKILDRATNTVLSIIDVPSNNTNYHCLQFISKFDFETFPYLILKD